MIILLVILAALFVVVMLTAWLYWRNSDYARTGYQNNLRGEYVVFDEPYVLGDRTHIGGLVENQIGDIIVVKLSNGTVILRDSVVREVIESEQELSKYSVMESQIVKH